MREEQPNAGRRGKADANAGTRMGCGTRKDVKTRERVRAETQERAAVRAESVWANECRSARSSPKIDQRKRCCVGDRMLAAATRAARRAIGATALRTRPLETKLECEKLCRAVAGERSLSMVQGRAAFQSQTSSSRDRICAGGSNSDEPTAPFSAALLGLAVPWC